MADTLGVVYSALGDPTRRGIVERLTHGELTVAELRRPLQMSAPAVSKHLRVLE
ncbi:MAG TPA: metalloregulator ArsR/SmtB family transcription factor, partial [Propionibacteriaceae bacterium]|nr:metalloregulator ArsR/SmtB family transcription factor [Propionibacteriaceae bacterium]